MMNKSGIYVIRNLVNGKCYYGSATKFHSRFAIHRYYLNKGTSSSVKLQAAWNKYGADAFEFRILFVCDRSDLLFYEQRTIDATDCVKTGYNICKVAGSALGIKRRPESIEKTAATHRGKKLSDEHKAKLSLAKKGVAQSKQAIAARTANFRGMKRSKEFCQQASERRQKNTPTAKLTHEDIPEIRRLLGSGLSGAAIARMYGVSAMSISDIKLGRTWEYV